MSKNCGAASSLRDRHDGLIDCAAAPRGSIVPAVVIYGANASGKSNLIHAIGTMRPWSCALRHRGHPAAACRISPSSSTKRHRGSRRNTISTLSSTASATTTASRRPKQRSVRVAVHIPQIAPCARYSNDRAITYRFGRELRGRNSVIAELTASQTPCSCRRLPRQTTGYFLSLNSFMGISVLKYGIRSAHRLSWPQSPGLAAQGSAPPTGNADP